MKSHTNARFWKFYLQFKRIDPQEPIYSVRGDESIALSVGWKAMSLSGFGLAVMRNMTSG